MKAGTKNQNNHGWIKLIISIILDILGLASYFIPFLGEISDIVWFAVESAWIYFAYKSTKFAVLGGLEEALPFTDILPMCTIAHYYTSKKEIKGKERF